jgi:peptidyl-prolyl cis-trans isomerase SurA
MRNRLSPAITAALLLFAALPLTGHAAERVTELNRIVAVVDDNVITARELDGRVESILTRLRETRTPIPSNAVLQRQVLERMVVERIQLDRAKRAGIEVEDEVLNRTVETIARDNKLTIEQFRSVLEKDGIDFARFREEVRNEMLMTRLRQREVDNRVKVSPQEVDEFLAKRKEAVGQNTEYHLSHLLIALPEGANPAQVQAARAEADEVLAQLRGGADFRALAVAHSDGQQALEGGDLGWRKGTEIPTLLAEVVPGLAEGGVSDLIRSPSGFHIVKLNAKRGEPAHVIEQTHARHILIRTNELVSDLDARERLLKLYARVEGGEDFAALARNHSEDTGSAIQGGDLGWANPGTFVPAFEEALGKLEPGQVSKPFKSVFGWHVVQVLERRRHDDTAEYLRNQAHNLLRQRKIEEEEQAWIRRLRDESYVELRLEGGEG